MAGWYFGGTEGENSGITTLGVYEVIAVVCVSMVRFPLDTTSARRFGSCLECCLVEASQPVSDCIQLWGSEVGEAVVLRRRQYEHLYMYFAGDLKYPKGRSWFVEGRSPRCPIEPENGRTGSLEVEIVIFYLRILPDRL